MRTSLIHVCRALLLACFLGLVAHATAATLPDDKPSVDLAGEISLLEDPSGVLSFSDLTRPEISERFQAWPAANGDLNLGFTASTWWVRLRLRRTADAPTTWILDVPYAYNKYLDFLAPYRPLVVTGHARPIDSRPIFSRHFAFPVELSEQPQDFYFRVASNYSLSLPLQAWQPSAYAEHSLKILLLESLYYGCLLALVIYNGFLWRSLHDRRFGHYALFGGFLNIGMFAANGLGRVFLWPDWVSFDEVSSGMFFSLSGVFFMAFARGFLRTRDLWPALDRLARGLGLFYLVSAVLFLTAIGQPLWISRLFQAQLALSPFALLLLLAALSRQKVRQQPGVSYFIIAWSFLAAGLVVATLRAFQWIPTNAWTAYAVQIGSSLELVFFSFALAAVVRQERQQRIEAQAEMLASKEKIINFMKDEEYRLETAVAARSQELNAALQRETGTLNQYLRFAALVSHEFRNGLNVISSQSELLNKESPSPSVQKRTEIIKQGVIRLATLTRKWLEGDRLLNTEMHTSTTPVALSSWLNGLLERSQQYSQTHRISIELAPDAGSLHADPEFLEIALSNLLDNACKYSPAGSAIQIRSLRANGMTGISVTDAGVGIPFEAQSAIFEPYYRVAPESQISGSGLGLNFVRRIAEAHRGAVTLESVPGRGSTFTIWFPDLNNESP